MTILSYLVPSWSNLWKVTSADVPSFRADHRHGFCSGSSRSRWNPGDFRRQPLWYAQYGMCQEPYGWPSDFYLNNKFSDSDDDDGYDDYEERQWFGNMNNSSSNIVLRKRRHRSQPETLGERSPPASDKNSRIIEIDVEPISEQESKRRKCPKTCRFSDDVEIISDDECFTKQKNSDSDSKLVSIENSENLINETSSYSVYGYLKVMLGDTGRQIDSIKGDGNCFFRALSKALYGNQKYHDKIRQAVVDLLEKYPNKFEAFADGPLQYHIEDMRQDKTWATQTEIYAAATLLGTNIYILSPDQTGDMYRWLMFTPQFKVAKPFSRQCSCYITLCHTHGNHYDRVAPLEWECNCALDPPEMSGVQGSVDLTEDIEIV